MKFEDMINTIQLGNCYDLIKNMLEESKKWLLDRGYKLL